MGRASRSVTTVTVATDGKVKESRHTLREKARIEGYIAYRGMSFRGLHSGFWHGLAYEKATNFHSSQLAMVLASAFH